MRRGSNERHGAARSGSAAWLGVALVSEAGSLTLWRLALRGWFSRPLLRALAANPGTPRPLLWLLAERRWDVQAVVAGNPRCPRRVQGSLAWSSVWAVRAAVAANPATDLAVVEMLVGRSAACVRLHAAANASLTQALADRLLGDRDPYVRAVAAAHPAASAEALRRLAEGMSEPAWVLAAIAANPSCPADLSDQLLTWIALGGPGDADPLFDPVACTGHPGDTRFTPLAWYRQEAKRDGAERHPLWRVRADVMRALGRLPAERARALARDLRPEVRRTIAGVSQLPESIRQELMSDGDAQVARLAAGGNRGGTKGQWRAALRIVGPLFSLAAVLGVVTGHFPPSAQPPSPRHSAPARTAGTPGTGRPGVGGAAGLRRALPDGGSMSCGLLASGTHVSFVYVAAGSRGLMLRVTNAVMTVGGRAVRNPVTIPAGVRERFLLHGSGMVSVTAGRGGGPQAGAATTSLRCGR